MMWVTFKMNLLYVVIFTHKGHNCIFSDIPHIEPNNNEKISSKSFSVKGFEFSVRLVLGGNSRPYTN